MGEIYCPLSGRAYLYLSLAYVSSGPFARFANCTVAPAHFARAKERTRERERDKFPRFPPSPGFVIGVSLSLYFGSGWLQERKVYIEKETFPPCLCVESGRRWVKDSHPFEGPTDDARGPPTFDLYRLLSIFRNLLLRILNVRISARQIRGQPKRRESEAGAAKRAGVVGSSRIRNTSSFCYRPPLRHGETLP